MIGRFMCERVNKRLKLVSRASVNKKHMLNTIHITEGEQL